jgi:hypothetical protein
VLLAASAPASEQQLQQIQQQETQQRSLFDHALSTNRFITTLDLNHVTLPILVAVATFEELVDNRNVTLQNLEFFRIEKWDRSLLEVVPHWNGLWSFGMRSEQSLLCTESYTATTYECMWILTRCACTLQVRPLVGTLGCCGRAPK